jgi:hypothetical protein
MAETIEATYELNDQFSKEMNKILASMDKFNKEAAENNQSAKKTSDGIAKVGKAAFAAVGGIGLATAAVNKLVGISKESIELFKTQEKAERLVAFAFGEGAGEIQRFASELQNASTVGDEATLQYAAFLKQMNLTNTQVKQVLQAAVDLSATGLVPMESAVKNLAKTYGGLSGELGESIPALKNLTKEQLVAGEGVKLISEQYAGLAAAVADTDAGRIEQLNNAIGDLQEEMGEELIPVQLEFVKTQAILQDLLTDNAEAFRVVGFGAAKLAQVLVTAGSGIDLIAETVFNVNARLVKLFTMLPFVSDEVKAFGDALVEESNEDFAESLENTSGALEALLTGYEEAPTKIEATTKAQDDLKESLALTTQSMKDLAAEEKKREESVKRSIEAAQKLRENEIKNSIEGAEAKEKAELKAALTAERLRENEIQRSIEEAEEADLKRITEREKQLEFYSEMLGHTQTFVSSTSSIINSAFQSRINDITAESRAEIEAVNASTMSRQKKADAIAKIEKDAQKKSLELRKKQWGVDLASAGTNTALAITNALATVKPTVPNGVLAAAAVGSAGAAQVASIAASKPRFAGGGVVGGTSFTGDSVDIRANSGERILTRQDQTTLSDVLRGGAASTTNNSTTNNITVQTLDPDLAAPGVVRALEHAVDANQIDETKLSVAAV